ncbi:MAG: ATPase, T2SS/T4P/T4SS family [Desulfobulbaceae bacterium]|nr:ATPase, T2SS/T4P/T4SS family [Desulfobulbaceae bacterium]
MSKTDGLNSFETFLQNIKTAPSLNALNTRIRNQLLDVFWVEMATIYLVDHSSNLLVSWVLLPGESLRNICTPITKSSISGCVASTGKRLLIRDVYDFMELSSIDPELKFDSSWDRKTGNRTRQILTVPIIMGQKVVGVIQLINKRHNGNFIDTDEQNSEQLAAEVGQIIAKIQKSKAAKKPSKYDKVIEKRLLGIEEFKKAIALAKQHKRDLESILLENFSIDKEQLGSCIAEFYNTNFVDLATTDYDPSAALKGMNLEIFRDVRLLPLSIEENKVVLASDNPVEQAKVPEVLKMFGAGQAEVLFAFGFDFDVYLERLSSRCLERERAENLAKIADTVTENKESGVEAESGINSKSNVTLVAKIIEEACKHNATDIHIEPYGTQKDAEVRFRMNGTCKKVLAIPMEYVLPVIGRFKMLAGLDLDQHRKVQNGTIKFLTSEGKDIGLRVATIPTSDGNEDLVVKVLIDRVTAPVPLQKIMPDNIFTPFKECLEKAHGMVLVVGPADSGVNTTLHLALGCINTPEKKIWTVENKIDINQYRIRQVQVDPESGLTVASALRVVLDADPDVIMVGEMEEANTIKLGLEASLSDHLVLGAMHADSVEQAIKNLFAKGLGFNSIAESLRAILAQRLLRTLCPRCKEAYTPEKSDFDHLVEMYGIFFFDHLYTTYSENLTFYHPRGCEECNGTGYKGKVGVFELLLASRAVKNQIAERAPADMVVQEAINEGMTTLIQEGIKLIFSGTVDYKQAVTVCGD